MSSRKVAVAIAVAALIALVGWSARDASVREESPEAVSQRHEAIHEPAGLLKSAASSVQKGVDSARRALSQAGLFSSGPAFEQIPSMPPGLHLMPLDQQQMPEEVRHKILEELRNLRETGSTSGGRKTHEFAQTDYLSRQLQAKGYDSLVRDLAIIPSNLIGALGGGWELVGADVQAKLVTGLGWSGFGQVVRAPSSNRMVELSEMQFDVLGGDGAVISPEIFNGTVGQHPATIEVVRDDDGSELFTFSWIVADRRFSMSTKGLTRDEAAAVALRISQAREGMPHNGWQQPYEYNEENPLHRYTRMRMKPSPGKP